METPENRKKYRFYFVKNGNGNAAYAPGSPLLLLETISKLSNADLLKIKPLLFFFLTLSLTHTNIQKHTLNHSGTHGL